MYSVTARFVCIGPLLVSLCSLGGAPSAIRRLADPRRWRRGRARARARSIFAVSIGRSILAGVARRRRSRDSRTLRKIPRDESTFHDFEALSRANRFSSFVILANICIVREILSSRIRSLFSAAKILLIEEKITNHLLHTIVFC